MLSVLTSFEGIVTNKDYNTTYSNVSNKHTVFNKPCKTKSMYRVNSEFVNDLESTMLLVKKWITQQ